MITHHPPFEMLLDYAAGSLTEGVALAVATHASLCPRCRSQVIALEAAAGALFDDIEGEPVGDELLASVLGRLDEPEAPVAHASALADEATRRTIPAPLRRYIGRSLDELPWRRSLGRMFQEARLPLAGKGIKVSLMRLRPGSLMPKHTHRGHEYTLVLAGGYQDASGRFGPGDFDVKDAADHHQPVVDKDEECLCLAVLDAPIRLTGTIGRLVNPFLRI